MTQDQRSFVSKAGLPVALYLGGMAAVLVISAIWGVTAHAFGIDLVALAFTYTVVIGVFLGVVRAAQEADDEPIATTKTEEPPHGLRHAA